MVIFSAESTGVSSRLISAFRASEDGQDCHLHRRRPAPRHRHHRQNCEADDEWRKQLSPDAFQITRNAATERPYTNENPNDHAPGVFRCICCDTALFDANTKFDSGTGWPSFWAPIAKENVLESADISLAMIRTTVSCRVCDAHLGHVFDDGPRPTGLRYCMNALAMRFAKAA